MSSALLEHMSATCFGLGSEGGTVVCAAVGQYGCYCTTVRSSVRVMTSVQVYILFVVY